MADIFFHDKGKHNITIQILQSQTTGKRINYRQVPSELHSLSRTNLSNIVKIDHGYIWNNIRALDYISFTEPLNTSGALENLKALHKVVSEGDNGLRLMAAGKRKSDVTVPDIIYIQGGIEVILRLMFHHALNGKSSSKSISAESNQKIRLYCLEILQGVCLVVEQVALIIGKYDFLIEYLFTSMEDRKTFSTASALLEELLSTNRKIVDLSQIKNIHYLAMNIREASFPGFCRLLSTTVADIDFSDQKGTLLAQDKEEQDRSAEKTLADKNQGLLLSYPEFLSRMVKLASKPFPSGSNLSNIPSLMLSTAPMNLETYQDIFLGDQLASASSNSSISNSSRNDSSIGNIFSRSTSRGTQTVNNGSSSSDNTLLTQMDSPTWLPLPVQIIHEVMHKVEILYVLTLFLCGKYKYEVQSKLSEIKYISMLWNMFEELGWNSESDRFPRHNYREAEDCDCTPESALKIQFLRFIHSFCDHNDKRYLLLSFREVQEMKDICDEYELSKPPALDKLKSKYRCHGSKGVITKILDVLKKTPANNALRFWLSRAVEGFLRGSVSSPDQHFLINRGLIQHLYEHIINCDTKAKEIIQSSFDLLGEVMKFNVNGFQQFNRAIQSDAQFDKFLSVMSSSVVDSNMFIRCIILSHEQFAQRQNYDLLQCHLCGLIRKWEHKIYLMYKLITTISVDSLTQENVSCLNTTLIFLMFAYNHGQLDKYLQAFVTEEEAQKHPGLILSNLSCYPIAVQSVRDAVSKDVTGKSKEAYCDYLNCIMFILQALKNEACEKQDLQDVSHSATFKLFKLTENCLERAQDILKTLKLNDIGTSPTKAASSATLPARSNVSRRYSQPPPNSPHLLTVSSRTRNLSVVFDPGRVGSDENLKHATSRLHSPPGYDKASVQNFQVRRHDMFQAYQRRKTLEGNIEQRYAAASFNLSMFRKEAEKQAIIKAKEQASFSRFLERQKQMKGEAEKRWNRRENQSSRDREYRQNLLASILAFEEEERWPKTFRATLTESCDAAVIMNAIRAILSSRDHPLSKVLHEIQRGACGRIKILTESFGNEDTEINSDRNEYLIPTDSFKHGMEHSNEVQDTKTNRTVDPPSPPEYNTDSSCHNEDLGLRENQDGEHATNGGEGQIRESKDTPNSRLSISLECDFDEMGEDMFSESDEEAERSDEEKKDISFEKTEKTEINSKQPTSDSISNITIKVVDDAENEYHELQPGTETLRRNREFMESCTSRDTAKKSDVNDYTLMTLPFNDDYMQLGEANVNDDDNDDGGGGYNRLQDEKRIPSNNADGYDRLRDGQAKKDTASEENINKTVNQPTDDNKYELLTISGVSKPFASAASPTRDEPDSDNVYEEICTVATNQNLSPVLMSRKHEMSKKIYRRLSSEMVAMINTHYLKELDCIVQDLLFGFDRLHSVLLLTYEGLDTAMGRDQSYATLEDIFFGPVWPWIIRMFRQLNYQKEEVLYHVMENHSSCRPQDMKICHKFCLGGDDDITLTEPYELAIEELRRLSTYQTPLEKLECTVRTSKAICHCVDTYWIANGETKPPTVGCDDLLSILCYVIIKTKSPQIVSECHAMEEFIHEGYLMGEEGYCVTTLHAAITFLLTLQKS